MRSLGREEMLGENQDPPEEIEWGRRMSAMRSKFLKELVDEMEADNRRKKNAGPAAQPSYSSSGLAGKLIIRYRPTPALMKPSRNIMSQVQESGSSRRSRSHKTTAPTADGSRGSSYGHDYTSQHQPSVQQPVPRAPRAPQPRNFLCSRHRPYPLTHKKI